MVEYKTPGEIEAMHAAYFRCFYALTVDNRQTRLGLPPGFLPNAFP